MNPLKECHAAGLPAGQYADVFLQSRPSYFAVALLIGIDNPDCRISHGKLRHLCEGTRQQAVIGGNNLTKFAPFGDLAKGNIVILNTTDKDLIAYYPDPTISPCVLCSQRQRSVGAA